LWQLLRQDWKAVAGIFLAALGVRLVYLVFLTGSPLFDAPAMDSLIHDRWARQIATENFWGTGAFFRAPLYAYFLSPFYALFGESVAAYTVIRVVQFGLGALSCVLLYLIGRQWRDAPTGWVAGGMAALYWPFIYFEGELLFPFLLNVLNLTAFLALLINLQRPRLTTVAVAGVAMGLSAITRPNILLFFPLLFAWVWFTTRRRRGTRTAARQCAVLGLAIAMCIAPVTLRNYWVGGDLVLIASQGGVNFYIGNNPGSDGQTAIVPGTRPTWEGGYEDTILIAERARGRPLLPSEVSTYWMEQGMQFLADHPTQALQLYLHKLRLLFDWVEHSNNQDIYFFRAYVGFLDWPLFLGFWFVVPLGIIGFLMGRKDASLVLWLGFVAIYLGSFLLFFITARFRVPGIPFLMLPAAAFLVDFFRDCRAHRPRKVMVRAAAVGVVALLMWAVASRFPEPNIDGPGPAQFTLAGAYHRKGDFERAESHLTRLTDYREPFRSRSFLELGKIHFEQGNGDEAVAMFREATRHDAALLSEIRVFLVGQLAIGPLVTLEGGLSKESEELMMRSAVSALQVGELAAAERLYLEILDRAPDNFDATLNLAWLYTQDARSMPRAIEVYRRGLEQRHDDETLLFNLAQAYWKTGQLDEAEKIVTEKLLARRPDDPKYLGLAQRIRDDR